MIMKKKLSKLSELSLKNSTFARENPTPSQSPPMGESRGVKK